MSDKKDEINVFMPEVNEMTLSNGDKIEIKTLPWGKEIKVCQLVSKFFDDNNLVEVFNKISESDESSNSFDSISKLVIPLVNSAPESITKIVSLIINKEENYVEESLTSDDVMQVFIPFLKTLFNKYTKLFQKVSLI